MKLVTKFTSVFDRTLDAFSVLAGVLLVTIMLTVSIKVFFRYFLHTTILAVDEIAEISMLYLTFLAAAWLLRRGGHITIDLLFARLKPKTQARLNIITSVFGLFLSLILVWYGTAATVSFWQRGILTPTIMELPRAAIIAVIPVGSLLLGLQFLRRAWSYRKANWIKEKPLS